MFTRCAFPRYALFTGYVWFSEFDITSFPWACVLTLAWCELFMVYAAFSFCVFVGLYMLVRNMCYLRCMPNRLELPRWLDMPRLRMMPHLWFAPRLLGVPHWWDWPCIRYMHGWWDALVCSLCLVCGLRLVSDICLVCGLRLVFTICALAECALFTEYALFPG